MLRVVLYVSLTSPEKYLLVDSSFTKFYLMQSYLSEQKPNNVSMPLNINHFSAFFSLLPQLERHISEQCPLTEVTCPYAKAGCPYKVHDMYEV